jgi:hypothetical protein
VAIALLFAHIGYDSSRLSPNDWVIFEVGARSLTHWHGMAVYAGHPLRLYADNPIIQIGPPALLPVVATQWMSPHTVNVLWVVVMALMGVTAIGCAELTGRALVAETSPVRRQLTSLVLGAPLAAAWAYQSGRFHHLDDAMGLLAIAVATWLVATKRSSWLVGLCLGVGVAAKPWAVVATPLILGLSRAERPKAALAAVASAVAFWAPFVLGATDTINELGRLGIIPRGGSILYLLGVHTGVQSWLRPVQFTAGLAVAGYVAWRGRWAAAPLAGIAVRVALDPYAYGYYGLGPVLAAMIWDLSRRTEGRRYPVWTIWTLVVEFGLRLFLAPTTTAWFRLAWVISVIGVFVVARKVEEPAAVDEPAPSTPAVVLA